MGKITIPFETKSSDQLFPKNRFAKKLLLFLLLGFFFVNIGHAQQRSIINSGFEDGPVLPGPGGFIITNENNVDGWRSTNGTIEVWATGHSGVPSSVGNYHVELNPFVPIGLFQEICLVNGEVLSWSFDHRARSALGETVVYEVVDSDGNFIQNLDTSTLDPTDGWQTSAGSVVYTGPPGIQRIQFRSTVPPGSVGNFLDNIIITLVPYVEFMPNNLTTAEETGYPGDQVVAVLGVVPDPITVTLGVDASTTAASPSDYTLTSTTITIPPGNYDGTAATGSTFALPLTIADDGVVELTEQLVLNIDQLVGSMATVGPIVCGSAANGQLVYTITDNETFTGNTCSGEMMAVDLTTFFNDSLYTLSWVAAPNPDVDGESVASVTSNFLTDTLSNNTAVDQDVTYTVSILDAGGVQQGSFTYVNTVAAPVDPPVSSGVLELCDDPTATVADLVPSPSAAITWYSTEASVAPLAATDVLIDGNTYYATQTVAGCESEERLAVTVNFVCEADVAIDKTLTSTPAGANYVVGEMVTYDIVVSNSGPNTATNVVVTDTPTNLTITGVSGGGCSSFPCTIASIAAGTPANDVTITVTATIDDSGDFINAVTVSADQTDPDTTNNSDAGVDGNNGGTVPFLPPVADDETADSGAGETVNVNVLDGDNDPDGDNSNLTVTAITDPVTGVTDPS